MLSCDRETLRKRAIWKVEKSWKRVKSIVEATTSHLVSLWLFDTARRRGAYSGMPPPPDPYLVLGLRKEANPSSSDIRKAYHKLARLHHPDKARTETEKQSSELMFKEIGAAYGVLSDSEKRLDYDTNGFDARTYQTPQEQDAEEKHARRVYCQSMGIRETVVREVWCSMEEIFTGCTRREGVLVHVINPSTQAPDQESKVFTVRIPKGARDGREIKFGAMHTNNLQSVAFVVKERAHRFFEKRKAHSVSNQINDADVCARVALTPTQLANGTTLRLSTLSGSTLTLNIKPDSAVVKLGGVKVVAGEGFYLDGNDNQRGDLRVKFRVMSTPEVWARMNVNTYMGWYKKRWWVRVGTWCVAGYVGLWATVCVLEWALDLDESYYLREKIPDALLVGNFPGSYGIFGGSNNSLFYPRFRIPREIAEEWGPTGLGQYAVYVGMAMNGLPRQGKKGR